MIDMESFKPQAGKFDSRTYANLVECNPVGAAEYIAKFQTIQPKTTLEDRTNPEVPNTTEEVLVPNTIEEGKSEEKKDEKSDASIEVSPVVAIPELTPEEKKILREAYYTKFNKKPFVGWSDEVIIQKMSV